jgi:hypothetical protein
LVRENQILQQQVQAWQEMIQRMSEAAEAATESDDESEQKYRMLPLQKDSINCMDDHENANDHEKFLRRVKICGPVVK